MYPLKIIYDRKKILKQFWTNKCTNLLFKKGKSDDAGKWK